jgi:hypothetical protein
MRGVPLASPNDPRAGTRYEVRVRLGLTGSHTWTATTDWRPHGPVLRLATAGSPGPSPPTTPAKGPGESNCGDGGSEADAQGSGVEGRSPDGSRARGKAGEVEDCHGMA